MYLKNVRPGHTYKMGNSIFTVALVRFESGKGCMVETMRDKAAGIPASTFTRPGLTTVEEVIR